MLTKMGSLGQETGIVKMFGFYREGQPSPRAAEV